MTKLPLLVVDDNPVNRKLACAFLKKCGLQGIAVENGETALIHLGETRFSAVLLDISMPGLSGFDVISRLRGDLGLTHLPVLAYTAHAQAEDQSRLLAAGFNGILIKPINLDVLQGSLAEIGLL